MWYILSTFSSDWSNATPTFAQKITRKNISREPDPKPVTADAKQRWAEGRGGRGGGADGVAGVELVLLEERVGVDAPALGRRGRAEFCLRDFDGLVGNPEREVA